MNVYIPCHIIFIYRLFSHEDDPDIDGPVPEPVGYTLGSLLYRIEQMNIWSPSGKYLT